MLWSASDNYESARSDYKSTCDPYFGYSKDDESACGSYGYARTAYNDAKGELEDALHNVALFCGNCDQFMNTALRASAKQAKRLQSEISSLRSKVKKLEAENKVLNDKIKRTQ
jgi:hypothetical protein